MNIICDKSAIFKLFINNIWQVGIHLIRYNVEWFVCEKTCKFLQIFK